MKIIKIMFFVLFTMITLSACGKKEEKITQSLDFVDVTFDNAMGTLDQNYWSMGADLAKGEKGYYYESNDAIIMYFDPVSKKSTPLCSKIDCLHNDSSCNAYVDKSKYDMRCLYANGNYLYVIARASGKAYLERISQDGSSRKQLGEIGVADSAGSDIKLAFSNKYVYVFDGGHMNQNKEYTEVIKRFTLEGTKEETVFTYNGTNLCINAARTYGDKLFFLIDSAAAGDGGVFHSESKGLFVYDETLGIAGKVVEGNVSDYCIDTTNNTLYYYVEAEGLYKYNLSTKNKTLIFEQNDNLNRPELSFDGNYIYMDNVLFKTNLIKPECLVLDKDGAIVNRIPEESILYNCFGDTDYMFAAKIFKDKPLEYVYINKSNLETTTEWTEIGE